MRGIIRALGRGLLTGAGLIAGLEGAFAQNDPPVGLVMALSGNTSPPIAVMAEISPGTPLRLGLGTQLTFLHYGRCKLVTVSGGTLSLGRTEFQTDGEIVAEKDGPCPRIHPLSEAGAVAGGILMRGGGALPRLPLDHEIVVVGRGINVINAGVIYAEDKFDAPLVRLQVSGHSLRFPASSERLTPNGRYVLRLAPEGRTQAIDIPFIATAPDGPELVLLLR
jgi:hypothetical protein